MGTTTALLKVRDPLDKTAPALSFATGEAPLLVTQPTPLVATVADQNLDEWKLEIAPLGSAQFRTLASGQSAIDNAPLIELDPNEFVNGFYQLLLTARDISGRESRATAAIEVNTPAKTTAYRRTETDLVWTLAGVSFALARTYDSLRRETSAGAGYGWSLDFRDVDLQTNVPATGQEPLGVFRALGDDTRQYLTLPTGSRVGFNFVPQLLQVAGVSYYRPAWVADAGVAWQLSSVHALLVKSGTQYFDEATGQPYHPASPFFSGPDYTLTSPDGTQYLIDSQHGITEQRAPGGGRLFYSDSGVSTLGGETIRFVQDAAGRLSRVIAPDGRTLIYQYDALGNLVLVRHLTTGQSTQYGYDQVDLHQLTLAVRNNGGEAILYGGVPATVPLDAHLGNVGLLAGDATTGQLIAAGVERYSFGLLPSELASVTTGQVVVRTILTSQPGGPSLDVPTIAGLPAVSTFAGGGRVEALFAVPRSGLQQLRVQGTDTLAAGNYTLQITVGGDINADGLVDGLDSVLLDAAFGSVVGDPAYSLVADLDGNGTIAAADRQILIANFGFTANRAPILVTPIDDVLTHEGLRVAIDTSQIVIDPDGDDVYYRITGETHGLAQLSADGRYVLFAPEPGYTGPGDCSACRGRRDKHIGRGHDSSHDQRGSARVARHPEPAASFGCRRPGQSGCGGRFCGPAGRGTGSAVCHVRFLGTRCVLRIGEWPAAGSCRGHRGGNCVAWRPARATAVSVGQPSDALGLYVYTVGLEVYPESLALPLSGGQRQLLVGIKPGDTQWSSVASGTVYVVSDSALVSVSADGLVTAVGAGDAIVTVLHGAAEAVIPVRIAAPHVGPTELGTDGGTVQSADGALVSVGPGALEREATVSIATMTEADLPIPIPDFLTFGAAFELDFADVDLARPAQVAIPVPAGFSAGQEVYFWRYETLTAPDGSTQAIWMLTDKGVVGADGMARTTSPPYPGFSAGGQYLCSRYDSPDTANIQFRTSLPSPGTIRSVVTYLRLGLVVQGIIPPVFAIPYVAEAVFHIWNYPDESDIPTEDLVTLHLEEGLRDYEVDVTLDEPDEGQPIINSISVDSTSNPAVIHLAGQRLTGVAEALFVMGAQRWTVPASTFDILTDTEVEVPVPVDAIIGLTDVYLVDRMLGTSNAARLTPPGGFGFVGLETTVGAFSQSVNGPTAVQQISVTTAAGQYVRDVVSTQDNTRVYVGVVDVHAGATGGQIAVVDPLTFRTVDHIPLTIAPWRLAVDPDNKHLFAAGGASMVQVVDIDPESPSFHQIVRNIILPHERVVNDGLAVTVDGRRLFVSTYTDLRGSGNIVVVNLDRHDSHMSWGQIIADVPLEVPNRTFHPSEIVVSNDPASMLVTSRVIDAISEPYVFPVTIANDDSSHFELEIGLIKTVVASTTPTGGALNTDVIRRSVEQPSSVAIMPDRSYAFVTDFAVWMSPELLRVQRGAKVGVIRDPFGLRGTPAFLGATTPIERGYADEVRVSADGSRLFVNYGGIHEVLVMSTEQLIAAAEALTPEQRLQVPLDDPSLPYHIHIAPLVSGTDVSGFALQRGGGWTAPLPVFTGDHALFTRDYTSTVAADTTIPASEYSTTIEVRNDADPATSQTPMVVTIDFEEMHVPFLADASGMPVQDRYIWYLGPGATRRWSCDRSRSCRKSSDMKRTACMVPASTCGVGSRAHRRGHAARRIDVLRVPVCGRSGCQRVGHQQQWGHCGCAP